MKHIDINCDMGEVLEAVTGGAQESLMPSLSSVNIACGGHAGDESMMRTTIEQAKRYNLAIGAHPGYPDRENFGRLELNLNMDQVEQSVFHQLRLFGEIAAACRAEVVHVKPHGALYNQAVRNSALARAIANGVARWRKDVVLVGLAGSPMLDVFRDAGFTVAAEAFADRRYEPDGSLRARKHEDALLRNPMEAAKQAVSIARDHTVTAVGGAEVAVDAQTICLHGDTPGAPAIAAAVAEALAASGIAMAPLAPRRLP